MNNKPTIFSVLLIGIFILCACIPANSAEISAETDVVSITTTVTPTVEKFGEEALKTQTSQTTVETQTDFSLTYSIVDTGQSYCFSDTGSIPCPENGDSFYGQDAQYSGNQPQYRDNGDGTITDLVTGLMWTQSPDLNGDGEINIDDKLTWDEAIASQETFTLAGYSDWRIPSIKELYSLMNFNGYTGSTGPSTSDAPADAVPYIDTDYFDFGYGDGNASERYIDAQFVTTTIYESTVMNGQTAMFGLNLADGRIKGYPIESNRPGEDGKGFYVLYVRGSTDYGINEFVDNGNGTISDLSTGLTWMQTDSGTGLDWQEALDYCENLEYGGINDWRLPNAKELQSIVDYSRSPDTTGSAAIDPLFEITYLPNGINDSGEGNYPYFWTSTTHLDGMPLGSQGVYVAFGEARGYMDFGSGAQLMDVHGAGAQRSDPKSGDPSTLGQGHGPQGDLQSIYNYARCVYSGVDNEITTGGNQVPQENQPQNQPESQPVDGAPPQAAVDACISLNQGDSCSFQSPNGTISGTCLLIEQTLACVPEDRQQP